MAEPLVVACTHCSAKLKLKEELAGKKIRCPKCQEPFVVPGPNTPIKPAKKKASAAKPPADDDFGFLDDLKGADLGGGDVADETDDEFGDAPPARRSASKSKAKKKRRSSGGGNGGKIAIIAGLVILGIGLLGGIGYGVVWLVQNVGGAGSRMAWLPDNTEMFIEVQVADVWGSQVLQPVTSSEAGQRVKESISGSADIDLEQIDRVVVGGSSGARQPVVVIYAKGPIELPKLTDGLTAEEYGGHKIYRDERQSALMFLPEPSVCVRGPEADVKSAIDRNGACAASGNFGFLPSGHIVFGTTSPQSMSRGGMPGPGAGMDLPDAKSVAAGISFTSNIDIEFTVVCNDSGAAEKFATDLEQKKTEAIAQMQQQKSQLQPNPFMDVEKLRAMMDSQEQILNSFRVSQSGSSVTGEVAVPGEVVQNLADAIGQFMPMMPGMRGSSPPSITPPRPVTPPPSEGDFSSPGEQP